MDCVHIVDVYCLHRDKVDGYCYLDVLLWMRRYIITYTITILSLPSCYCCPAWWKFKKRLKLSTLDNRAVSLTVFLSRCWCKLLNSHFTKYHTGACETDRAVSWTWPWHTFLFFDCVEMSCCHIKKWWTKLLKQEFHMHLYDTYWTEILLSHMFWMTNRTYLSFI